MNTCTVTQALANPNIHLDETSYAWGIKSRAIVRLSQQYDLLAQNQSNNETIFQNWCKMVDARYGTRTI